MTTPSSSSLCCLLKWILQSLLERWGPHFWPPTGTWAALWGWYWGVLGGTTHPPVLTQPNWGCGASGVLFMVAGKGTNPNPWRPNPPAWVSRVSLGAPAVPWGLWLHPDGAWDGGVPAGLGVPGVPSQHWLQGDGPSPRRPSRDSVVPVGVGGVTMMEGTCRCFCPEDAVAVPSLPLLTHIFKPGGILGDKSGSGTELQHPPAPCPPRCRCFNPFSLHWRIHSILTPPPLHPPCILGGFYRWIPPSPDHPPSPPPPEGSRSL